MNKLTGFIVVALVLLLLCGCSNRPNAVAKKFFDAIQQRDFATAKKLCTADSQELLDLLQGFADKLSEEQKADMGDTKFVVKSTQIEGDNATVTYEQYNTQEPDKKDTGELKLVKESGEWKVKLEKGNASK